MKGTPTLFPSARPRPPTPSRTALLLILGLAAQPVGAARFAGEGLLSRLSSCAVEDDAAAIFHNPAGLGWATPTDFLLALGEIQRDSGASPARLDARKSRLAGAGLQLGRVGIGYERLDPEGATRADQWTVASRWSGPSPWISLGLASSRLSWNGASTWRYRAGLLLRPHNAVSLGAVAGDLTQSRIGDRLLRRSYRLGLGLRPLSGGGRHRMTLFADLEGGEDETWSDAARVQAGVRVEAIQGLFLSGAVAGRWGDFDDPEYRVGAGIQFLSARLEAAAGWMSDGGTPAGSGFALHVSDARPRPVAKPSVLASVRVGGRLADETVRGVALPVPFLGTPGTRSAEPILRQLRRAREDDAVRGVLLKIEPVSGGALLEEIRREVEAVRSIGKPVVAYLETGGSHNGYALAASCDRIVLAPRGALYLLGLRADVLYYGEMLDSLGVGVERITSGPYKSAYESYERSSASAGFKEAIESVFDDRWDHWVDHVSRSRGLPPDTVRAYADGRVLRAPSALERGFIDRVGTLDDAEDLLRKTAGAGGSPLVQVGGWKDRNYDWGPPRRIAVYYMNGFVNVGKSSRPFFGGGNVLGAETVTRDLKALARSGSVDAVVLRVDSGGGLGLAGSLIREAVLDFKSSGKPLVVSMGRVAASAAYHFSAAADRIVADPGTITGSIGVLVVRPDYAGLLQRARIHPETFQRGDVMGLWSFVSPLTPAERDMAQEWIEADYEEFVEDVASDRGMDRDAVHAVGQGRVWTGRQALERGLVDELGGLDEAVERARVLGGLGKDARILPIHRPERSVWDRVLGSLAQALPLAGFLAAGPLEDEQGDPLAAWPAVPGASPALLPGIPASAILPGTPRSVLPLEYSPIGYLLSQE